jgi:hypothetical protein
MGDRLDVGGALREVFVAYREHVGVLLPTAFWLFLFAQVVERLTVSKVSVFWIGAVCNLVVFSLYLGVVVRLVEDSRSGRDPSVRELAESVVPVLAPLIGAGILIVLGILVGTVLLIVPGLYLLTIWAVVAPAIVIERRGVFDAFGRSRQLVKGRGWPVFWLIVISFAITAVVSVLFLLVSQAVAEGEIVRAVLAVLASTVTAPIEGLVAAVLYFRLLALRPSAAAAPPPPAPPAPPVE